MVADSFSFFFLRKQKARGKKGEGARMLFRLWEKGISTALLGDYS